MSPLMMAGMAVLLIGLIAALHQTCVLNAVLPASMQATCASQSGFVGALSHVPEMQHCLAYTNDYRRTPYFNRCTWC